MGAGAALGRAGGWSERRTAAASGRGRDRDRRVACSKAAMASAQLVGRTMEAVENPIVGEIAGGVVRGRGERCVSGFKLDFPGGSMFGPHEICLPLQRVENDADGPGRGRHAMMVLSRSILMSTSKA